MHRGRCWLVAIALVCSGCTSYVTHKIEHPDRSIHQTLAPFRENLQEVGFSYEAMTTHDGVSIAYWRGDPRAYVIKEQIAMSTDGHAVTWRARLPAASDKSVLLPTRGSILLLHPWEGEGSMLAVWAYHFAASGYVVVMPDLRSQGDSSLAPVGYGPREGRDVAELVEKLRASHRLPAPLFLLGISYGGTAALFAARDLDDVRGVVALEPYGNAADVIRRAPSTGLFGPHWLSSVIGATRIGTAIDRANQDLGIDLNHIDAVDAMDGSTRCTLIVRGSHDSLLPAASLRAIAARSSAASYVEVSDEGHLSLPLRTDRLVAPLVTWMQQVTDGEGTLCPFFEPLPSPQAVEASSAQGKTGGT